jgi:hypothetical protein
LRFGAFEADLEARELRKQGVLIKLQDQPFHRFFDHPPCDSICRTSTLGAAWEPEGRSFSPCYTELQRKSLIKRLEKMRAVYLPTLLPTAVPTSVLLRQCIPPHTRALLSSA